MSIDAQVARARAAQPSWAATSVRARATIIEHFRALVFDEREAIARTVTAETGKPLAESLVADISMALDGARFLCRVAERTLAPERKRSRTMAAWRKSIAIHHDPFGVVGIVSPWNYPFFFPAMHSLTALIAGNAVLLKPSEHTPLCAEHIGRLLAQAGLPTNVFTLVQGDGRVGAELVNANVDKIFFTGSERTGRTIAVACAPRFVPVSLELGGSDAAIVLEDANFEIAASGIVWGRFTNAGQTCVAVKRVIAVGAAHDALVARIAATVSRLTVGTSDDANTDIGPLVTADQAMTMAAQLEDAIALGATVAARVDGTNSGGAWSPVVVLTNVTKAMRVWHEETFGPVLAVMRASSEADAVALANDSHYGLSASVWSHNRHRARRVAAQLQVGAVAINDSVINAGLPEVAHGGVKASGMGRIHGTQGLLECVRTRTVIDDFLPNVRQPWWFGYDATTTSNLDSYLRLAHGRTIVERLSGIPGAMRMLLRRRSAL